MSQFAKAETPLIKDRFINWFIDQYGVNMSEAVRKSANEYHCFNDFYQELETGARPIDPSPNSIVSPLMARSARSARLKTAASSRPRGTPSGWWNCWEAPGQPPGPSRMVNSRPFTCHLKTITAFTCP